MILIKKNMKGVKISFEEDKRERYHDKLIRCMSESLMTYIKDYDVCYSISKIFIDKRIRESHEETVKYHEKRGHDIYLRFINGATGWNKYHHKSVVEISYLATPRGIRDFPNLKNISMLKEIRNYDNQLISLKDKIDDVKKLPIVTMKSVGTNNYKIKQSNFDTLVPTDKWGLTKYPTQTIYTEFINDFMNNEYECEKMTNSQINYYL
jgi:hypothetical protein